MKKQTSVLTYFSKFELILWLVSILAIVLSFCLLGQKDPVSLVASLIGATALIFLSKGNVIGQILCVVFSVFYGIISYTFAYYGEMITYLGMSAPIAIASIVTWLKNPYADKKTEVKINRIGMKETIIMLSLGIAVTVAFYFILEAFRTANLIWSTISVLTSFIAAYLAMRRSEYYALAYAANDVVLIILWILASVESIGYLSMVICFVVFLINDTYGFVNWRRMKLRQRNQVSELLPHEEMSQEDTILFNEEKSQEDSFLPNQEETKTDSPSSLNQL